MASMIILQKYFSSQLPSSWHSFINLQIQPISLIVSSFRVRLYLGAIEELNSTKKSYIFVDTISC